MNTRHYSHYVYLMHTVPYVTFAAVCTNTVWLKPNPVGKGGSHLSYYGGNYDAFLQVTTEEGRVQVR